MPSIAEMIDKVAKLGVNEDNPDATLRAIYLGYIQSTYNELYGEVAKSFPSMLLATQSVTLSSGAGTLTTKPFIVVNVYNTDEGSKPLEPTDYNTLRTLYPSLSNTGFPSYFYMSGFGTIKAYPTDGSTLSVDYIPNPTTLVDGTTTEDDLIIPVPYQEVLVWGALRLISIDERDKAVGTELPIVNSMYEKLKGDFLFWLKNYQVRESVSVRGYLM